MRPTKSDAQLLAMMPTPKTTAGRKAIPAAEVVDHGANAEVLQADAQAATELVLLEEQHQEGLLALSARLGYDGPLTVGALEDRARFYQRRTVEACMELGKTLLMLKELTGHGEFGKRLELLGIHERMARRFMAASLKFAKTDTKSVLEAAGTQSKLLELVVLDDDEIELLSAGGRIGDIDLDSVAAMSTTELRAALREAREGMEAKDRVISSQEQKITSQAEALARPFKPKKGDPAKTADERAALDELTEVTNAVDVYFARLGLVAADLAGHDSSALRERALQAVQYLVARMREIVITNAIEVQVDNDTLCGRPDWLGSVQG